MNRNLIIIGAGLLALLILASASLFTVNQAQQALVVQLGAIKRVIQEPGLKAKIPFIEDVVYIDRRVLDLDPPAEQVILADQKRLVVDAFARYRITDPVLYFQSLRGETAARTQMGNVINSAMRRVLGSVTLLAILSEERVRVMNEIRDQVNQEAKSRGIEIVDVRIRRADLPGETSKAIFDRMSSERDREAAEARAQGKEQSQQIKARAERERTVILAEAQRDAQIQRGEGDNQSLKIIADATAVAPQFYERLRALEGYRKALAKESTTLVLSPTGEYLRFFGNDDYFGNTRSEAPETPVRGDGARQ